MSERCLRETAQGFHPLSGRGLSGSRVAWGGLCTVPVCVPMGRVQKGGIMVAWGCGKSVGWTLTKLATNPVLHFLLDIILGKLSP